MTSAAGLTAGSMILSTDAISATGVSYTLSFANVTSGTIKCIDIRITDTIGSDSKPTGVDVTSTLFNSASTIISSPASWGVTNNNTTGHIALTDASGDTTATPGTIVLTGITNGSVADTTYYVEVNTYGNTDCSTGPVDYGAIGYVYVNGVLISGSVNPSLGFAISSTSCSLGTLSSSAASSCSHTISAGTNASSGYTLSYLAATDLTSGSNTISDSGTSGATSTPGTEQFGLNLKNNATPDVGADPSGGSGTASTHYDTADTFSFDTSGATVATASSYTTTTTFTASYLANISTSTKAGTYATTMTYNITANY